MKSCWDLNQAMTMVEHGIQVRKLLGLLTALFENMLTLTNAFFDDCGEEVLASGVRGHRNRDDRLPQEM